MARALFHIDRWNGPEDSHDLQDRMLLILLDEMNLARVEYCFLDFLSRLESRPGRSQTDQAAARKDAELDPPVPQVQTTPRIFPGYNVLFAGTMNEDESTQSLFDKVVDSANVFRFAAPRNIAPATVQGAVSEPKALSRRRWQAWLRDVGTSEPDLSHANDRLGGIVDLMRRLRRGDPRGTSWSPRRSASAADPSPTVRCRCSRRTFGRRADLPRPARVFRFPPTTLHDRPGRHKCAQLRPDRSGERTARRSGLS
jgi:hypothetical protein